MALSAEQTSFVNTYAEYAKISARQVFWNPLACLADWALETGWGTAPLVKANNLAGMELANLRGFQAFPNLSAFASAYAKTLYADTPVLRQDIIPEDPAQVLNTSVYNSNVRADQTAYAEKVSEIWNELKAEFPDLAVNFLRPVVHPPINEVPALISDMQTQIAKLQADIAELKAQTNGG